MCTQSTELNFDYILTQVLATIYSTEHRSYKREAFVIRFIARVAQQSIKQIKVEIYWQFDCCSSIQHNKIVDYNWTNNKADNFGGPSDGHEKKNGSEV